MNGEIITKKLIETLPEHSKNYIFLGEAGCGKSELALNLAYHLTETGGRPIHFFDLDMTKPLFRSREQTRALTQAGVTVHFEEQFMDAPTLTGGVSRLLSDASSHVILDVGGDYIGARSIGGYAALTTRDNTVVFYVINPYRPWSMTLEHIDRVMGETLGVSHIPLSRVRLIANPNLGPVTTPSDVLNGVETLLRQIGPYKPIDLLCVREDLAGAVEGKTGLPVWPIHIHMSYPWT